MFFLTSSITIHHIIIIYYNQILFCPSCNPTIYVPLSFKLKWSPYSTLTLLINLVIDPPVTKVVFSTYPATEFDYKILDQLIKVMVGNKHYFLPNTPEMINLLEKRHWNNIKLLASSSRTIALRSLPSGQHKRKRNSQQLTKHKTTSKMSKKKC